MSCHALLQGIFLTQGSNPCLLCLLRWQTGSLPLVPPGKPLNHWTTRQFLVFQTSFIPPREASFHAGAPPRVRPSAWWSLRNHRFSTCLGGQRQARESISLSLGWNLSCGVIRPASQAGHSGSMPFKPLSPGALSEGRCRKQPMRSPEVSPGVTSWSTGEAAFQTPAWSLQFLIWKIHTVALPFQSLQQNNPGSTTPSWLGPWGPRQAFVKLDFS